MRIELAAVLARAACDGGRQPAGAASAASSGGADASAGVPASGTGGDAASGGGGSGATGDGGGRGGSFPGNWDCDPPEGTPPPLGLTEIVTGFDGPVLAKSAPGDPRLYVVEQPGLIRIFDGAQILSTPGRRRRDHRCR